MSIHPLVVLAWAFSDLVREYSAAPRVHEMIRRFLDAKSERPALFDIVWRDELFDPGPEVALTLEEKWVFFAVLQDEFCTGQTKLGPAIDTLDEHRPMEVVRLVWAALRYNARKLRDSPNEEYARRAQSWLAEVRSDLQAAVPQEPSDERIKSAKHAEIGIGAAGIAVESAPPTQNVAAPSRAKLAEARTFDWTPLLAELAAAVTSESHVKIETSGADETKEAAGAETTTTEGGEGEGNTTDVSLSAMNQPLAQVGGGKKPKRSTAQGEGRAKIIAALTKHHQYAESGCLNLEPIGNNELARTAGVSASTASSFFEKAFEGYVKYRAVCRDAGGLADSLKALNGEFSPHDLYGRRPAHEDDRDDECDE